MSQSPRRRRRFDSEDGSRSGGSGPRFAPWLLTVGAAIVVVAGGWFLGQALAHAFGTRSSNRTAQISNTPVPVATPLASPSGVATPMSSPTPTPTPVPVHKRTPIPRVTPRPSPSALPSPTPAPTPAPTLAPTSAPTLAPVLKTRSPKTPVPKTPTPKTPAPLPSKVPVARNPAEQTVYEYIAALQRGDPQSAAIYLGNGSPDEAFINAQTRITSMTSTRNADGSYTIGVDMQTTQGEYYETFQVASGVDGERILSKTAIKP